MAANPGTWNTEMHIGSRFYRLITYRDSAAALVDLTGYSARYTARRTERGGALIVELTVGSGITLGGALGTIELEIAATTTAAWTPGDAVHDLHLTPPSGAADTFNLLTGRLTVHDRVKPR